MPHTLSDPFPPPEIDANRSSMGLDFYRKRRRYLLRFAAVIRSHLREDVGTADFDIGLRNLSAVRVEMNLLRRDFHGGETFAWAPSSYTPRSRSGGLRSDRSVTRAALIRDGASYRRSVWESQRMPSRSPTNTREPV